MTKIDASISKLEYVLTYSPNDLKVLNSLAVYYSMKGQYDRGIDYLMKELNISPENPGVYYNLACIYSRQNRLKESRYFLDKAIKKGFNDWDQLRKDHDLDNLRNTTYFDNLLKNH
jgi:tetratricopeptide (TPR) repeat protein